MKNTILITTLILFISACSNRYYAVIEDKSPNNWRKERKLELTETRGNTMITITSLESSKEIYEHFKSLGYYSRKSIYKMWGKPDKVESKGGIDYCYFSIETFDSGSSPPGPAVLGFRGDELVYIKTWQASTDKNIQPVTIR